MGERKNLIQETYDEMETGGVFLDRFFFTDDYTPDTLVARDEQIKRIKELLKPVLQSNNPRKPQNGMLFGAPGTGKTAIMNAFLQDLDEWMQARQRNDIRTVYVNCAAPNTSALLASILRAVRDTDTVYAKDVPDRGISPREYFIKIFKEANRLGKRLIIVFDEIDKLKDKDLDLLYPFIRPSHMYTLAQGVSVSIIGIANSLGWMDKLDPRDKDAINTGRINFPNYGAPDLVKILEERCQGFVDGALEDGLVQLCAARAALSGGNARYAIQLLYRAGLIAERCGATVVTATHVRDAQIEINTDDTIKTVEDLPTPQKAVLAALITLSDDARRAPARDRHASRKSVFTSGEVYRRYVEICNVVNIEALGYRRIFDITKEIEQIDLIEIIGAHRGRNGQTREISLKADRDATVMAIKKEGRLEQLHLAPGTTVGATLESFS